MRYLVGEIAQVQAMQASRVLKDIDCPDAHALILQFENGALGSMTTTWAYDPRDWSHANVVDITFDQSLLRWSGGGLALTHAGETVEQKRPDRSIDAIFVDAVRSGDRSSILSPYDDGVRSLALSLAGLQSAAEGRPVAPSAL